MTSNPKLVTVQCPNCEAEVVVALAHIIGPGINYNTVEDDPPCGCALTTAQANTLDDRARTAAEEEDYDDS